MKSLILAFVLSVFLIPTLLAQDVYVKPYTRKDGTRVEGHYRSRPNAYKWDNKSYTPSQQPTNKSYNQPTKNYNSNWYTPSETRFQDTNPYNDSPPTGYQQQNYNSNWYDYND